MKGLSIRRPNFHVYLGPRIQHWRGWELFIGFGRRKPAFEGEIIWKRWFRLWWSAGCEARLTPPAGSRTASQAPGKGSEANPT